MLIRRKWKSRNKSNEIACVVQLLDARWDFGDIISNRTSIIDYILNTTDVDFGSDAATFVESASGAEFGNSSDTFVEVM